MSGAPPIALRRLAASVMWSISSIATPCVTLYAKDLLSSIDHAAVR